VREVTVTGTNFDFNPEQIQVRRGDRVRLTFTSESGFHDWVVDEIPDAKTNRLNSGQSQTIEFVADRVGTFEYYCSVGNHRQMGMVGSLVITE
jgi:plastocyanin